MTAGPAQEPLVGVVTPAYNAEQHLSECIESVLAQTYENWEYLIVDNRSTDATHEIAQRYAKQDPRIRVRRNTEHVGALQNHNIALRNIPPQAKYAKIVQADDFLFPDCLRLMVAVGEAYPSAGIVGSYTLKGSLVDGDGLPYPSTLVAGREVCRETLFGRLHVFLAPSVLLYRGDCVRRRERFFNESHLHADSEACFDVLQDTDFGFVHQVLTYRRVHQDSMSSTVAMRYNTYVPAWLDILQRYGHIYLSPAEFDRLWTSGLDNYYAFLARSLLRRKGPQFWAFHRRELERIGSPLSPRRLVATSLRLTGNVCLYPLRAVRRALALGGRRPGPA